MVGGYDAAANVCYMATPDGRSGFTVSGGGGGGAPWGASGLVGLNIGNARNSSDLSGAGGYAWASGGEGPYGAGASYSWSRNSCGEGIQQSTIGWAPGFRVPAPFAFGAGVNKTWTPGW